MSGRYLLFCETKIGKIGIAEDGDGNITNLFFSKEGHTIKLKETLALKKAFRELNEYLDGSRRTFDLLYSLEGTVFQKKVWIELQRIPYGTTVSYGEFAEMIGNPNAYRAVGSTVRKNPIPIFIPCHRIVSSDGTIGGYSHGITYKRNLLAIEGSI